MSIEEMSQWHYFFSRVDSIFPPAVFTPFDKKQAYFFIFDGTWNDKDNGEEATVPAKLYEQLIELKKINPRIEVQYFSGVGTRTSFFNKVWEGITGQGTKERANDAFTSFKSVIKEANEASHVYAIGFSRGAASARHFLNLVDQYYSSEHISNQINDSLFSEPRIYSMLFDTVATGQLDNLRLDIPEDVKSVVHFVATSEERVFFPVVRINQPTNGEDYEKRFFEFNLPGVHSDIGGGYGDALEKFSHLLATTWLNKQGVYIDLPKYDIQHLLNMGKNDSRWFKFGGLSNEVRQEVKLDVMENAQPDYSNLDEPLTKLMEDLGLVALSAQQNLKKLKEDMKMGKKKTFQGLVLNLFLVNDSLTIQTNCSDYISFNIGEGYVEVLGQPFITLTPEYLQELSSSYGLINSYPFIDRNNYIKAD